jgi:hypothetical protein
LRVLSAFSARKRDGEKPLLQVSPPTCRHGLSPRRA